MENSFIQNYSRLVIITTRKQLESWPCSLWYTAPKKSITNISLSYSHQKLTKSKRFLFFIISNINCVCAHVMYLSSTCCSCVSCPACTCVGLHTPSTEHTLLLTHRCGTKASHNNNTALQRQ